MRAVAIFGFALVVAAVSVGQWRGRRGGVQNPPLANTEAEKRILDVLNAGENAGRLYQNVPPEDGRMLRVLAAAANAKNAVEIGTSTGVSGLWFALALQQTGGRLTTFEMDPGRAAEARDRFQKAGVEGLITIVEGDAHRNLARVKGPVDVAFIDADKEGYVDYLKQLRPLMRPGGLILAHNTNMVPDYMRAVTTDAALETVVYGEGGGLAVTLVKR